MKRVLPLVMMSLFLTAACSEKPGPVKAVNKDLPAITQVAKLERPRDVAQIARGGKIFQQNCATCHGERAQGAPNWHTPGADGKYPPPALNGTAHTWHHPLAVLKHTINEGTLAIGGNMPGWKDKLSAQEVDDVLAWIQAKWPDDIWQTWAKNDARSRTDNN